MKKHTVMSLLSVGLLSSLNGADDLSSMFTQGKVSGQIREFSVARSYLYSDSSKDYTRTANAVGGYLKFETADFKGLSFGSAFYTTKGFLNDADVTDYKKVDPTLLGPDNEQFSILGEAYLQYKYEKTVFKAGRQKLDTPLAGSDDARMLPNLFEAYLLINSDIPNTTLIAGHVSKFAQGTFGRVYGAGGLLGVTSGYSLVDASNQVGSFVNMGTYAIDKETSGVSVVSATYTGIENLKLQLWDYYAHDILNAIYAQADFSWKCLVSENVKPFASVQVIKESDIGDKLAGDVNGLYVGGQFGVKVENFSASIAYSKTSSNSASESATANAIITPWGGMPAFTQGMVTRYMFLAGTSATKVAATYDWKKFGSNLKTVAYYVNFNMAENNGYTFGDASEAGFDAIYYPEVVKNLQLRLRGNFPTDFNVNATGDTAGWNEYRFIVNYNF